MNRQGRILVVDDLEKWRDQLVATLQSDGFLVDSESTVEQVLRKLTETFYHLLILDIRLEDTDQSNEGGIELLRELNERELSEATKVIMLSAHDTKEQMRTAFKDYKVSDFLSKDKFSRKILLESVHQVFSDDVHINLGLQVIWRQVTGPEQMVHNLEVEGKRLRGKEVEPEYLQLIAAELDDLLCRLFYQAERVLVRPLAVSKSPTGVLWAQPFYNNGGGRAVVVKFGDFQTIEEEYSNFKKYVQPLIGGGRNTTILDVRRTPHLGGIIYSLLGADSDNLEDFGHFYRHADISKIREVLDRLFLDTCSAWYGNRTHLQPLDLTADYEQLLELTEEKLKHAFSKLQDSVRGAGQQRLSFKSLKKEQTFTNPLASMKEPPLISSTYICTTHGDFNQRNLLVDKTGHTWLIDFQATGQGHILRDFAQLDSEIRFFLLAPEEATLDERLQMEEALCSIDRFSQVKQLMDRFSTANPALARAYAAVVHLRTLAHRMVEQHPADDISEYYIALFYNAMNTLRFYNHSITQREHALISASLLADRLGLKG